MLVKSSRQNSLLISPFHYPILFYFSFIFYIFLFLCFPSHKLWPLLSPTTVHCLLHLVCLCVVCPLFVFFVLPLFVVFRLKYLVSPTNGDPCPPSLHVSFSATESSVVTTTVPAASNGENIPMQEHTPTMDGKTSPSVFEFYPQQPSSCRHLSFALLSIRFIVLSFLDFFFSCQKVKNFF